MIAVMFSERWAGSHKLGEKRRIFLNYNPYCFDKILRHLRSKTLDASYQAVNRSDIDKEHAADYFVLLGHLGLLESMGYSSKENMCFVEDGNVGLTTDGRVVRVDDGIMKLTTDGRVVEAGVRQPKGTNYVCRATPVMPVDQVHFFKCYTHWCLYVPGGSARRTHLWVVKYAQHSSRETHFAWPCALATGRRSHFQAGFDRRYLVYVFT